MAIIERRNKQSTTFQVKVRGPDGKWLQARVFPTRPEAMIEEGRLLALKRRGAPLASDDSRILVHEYWEVWKVENRGAVSDGWKISQDQMYRDYIKPVIGMASMRDVGAPDIGRCLNRMKEQGLSEQLRKHVYSLLRKMFGDAVEYYEMLPTSPVKPKFHRPKVAQAKRSFLHPREAWQLLEAVRGHYLGPAIWVQTLAALRPGEVQALLGKHLLFPTSQILVAGTYNAKTKRLQDRPKQGDWSYVPMVKVLWEYLAGLRRGPDAFIATSPDGEKMLSYTAYLRTLKRICGDIGVPVVTPHELRHSCTEIWIQAGASPMDIQRLLCHATAETTRRYIHRSDDRLTDVAGNVVPLFPNRVPSGDKEADCSADDLIKAVQ